MYSFLTKTKATMKDPSYLPLQMKNTTTGHGRLNLVTPVYLKIDITSHISKYIKRTQPTKTQVSARREILPDASLKKAIREPTVDGDRSFIYHLKLQRYLNHQFSAKKLKSL
jgi:hypothetical protein